MIIIKMGGSFITYKKSDCSPPYRTNELSLRYRVREDRIRSVAREIKGIEEDIILVHGGGTHGHRTVTRWKEEWTSGSESMMAWEVRWRMDQLTNIITRIMGEEKVPTISVPSAMVVEMKDKGVSDFREGPIKKIIDRGCVPILRGDLTFEENNGWSVVSGDTIIEEMAVRGIMGDRTLEKVIMITDEEGFLDPETGRVIEEIDHEGFEKRMEVWNRSLSSDRGDVSGGILGKIISLRRVADMGIESYLVGGNNPMTLKNVIRGKSDGTRFIPKE